MKIREQMLGQACLVLMLAEVLLALLSWLLSATMMDDVRSLLSSEGVRWFFSNFTRLMASSWLVWLVLLLIALGCFQRSGLLSALRNIPHNNYRDCIALRMAVVVLVVYVAVILLLTVTPHAVLLSATGSLFPSAFSRSLVAVVAFGISLMSIVYGIMAGRFLTVSDCVDALSFGIVKGAPLFLLYILLVQFFESLRFVFV